MFRFLLSIILLFYTGCSAQDENTLTVTMSLGEDEWNVLRSEIFPPFEKNHNIKIKSYQIESGQLVTKLEALQRAHKSEIDVFAQDNMNLAPLIQKDLVLDLSPYEKEIARAVLPNLINACRFEKSLPFMPFRPNVQIIYFNAKAFKKYALKPPKTWDELLKVAQIFRTKEGTGRILIKGYGGNATATQIYEFILQAGGNPYSFNDEGCVQAFTFLQNLRPFLSPESQRAKWDTTNDILARSEAYLAQNWPFGVTVLVKKYNLSFIKTYSGWSGPEREAHVIGGDVFGIPKNSKKKDLALQFIFYMQSQSVQETLVSKLGWPSIRNDAYGQVAQWQRAHFKSVQAALQHGALREQVTWWPLYAKYVNAAFREIVMDYSSVRATLNKYKDELERAKEEYRKK